MDVPFMVHEPTKVIFDFGDFGGGEDEFFRIKNPQGQWVEPSTHELFEFKYDIIEARFGEQLNKEYLNFTIKYGFENRELNSGFESFGGEDSIHLISDETFPMHEWYIDGLLVGTDANYDGPISTGKHRINHRVMDASSNQSETNSLVRFNGGKQIWELKIQYKEEYPFETYNYGRLIVSMYKNGEWYTSDHSISNKSQSATIENVERVTLEQGQLPLVAFDIDFNAILLNETGTDSLSLSNMDGKFVVGLE